MNYILEHDAEDPKPLLLDTQHTMLLDHISQQNENETIDHHTKFMEEQKKINDDLRRQIKKRDEKNKELTFENRQLLEKPEAKNKKMNNLATQNNTKNFFSMVAVPSMTYDVYEGHSVLQTSNRDKKTSMGSDRHKMRKCLRPFSFIISSALIGGYTVLRQNRFFMQHKKVSFIAQNFPDCPSTVEFKVIGDGKCDYARRDGPNILLCGWEGGDCDTFNAKYPHCKVDSPELVGDGLCNGGAYNNEDCGFDGGDCLEFNEQYPNCKVSAPQLLGDGMCIGGLYNTAECGYDGGDCIIPNYPNCRVSVPSWVGDGECHGSPYNTEECGFDGNDCFEFNEKYPNCDVTIPFLVGNGECDSGQYNTEECGFDGGDCLEFNVNFPNCKVDRPSWIGDGSCQNGPYNTEECGFDGGDCVEFNEKYPNCNVNDTLSVGDGICDGEFYNVTECAFDGGDCLD